MGLVDHNLDVLSNFVPKDAIQDVKDYLGSYKIHLKIQKDRRTILGDYRPAFQGKPHTISVNGSLNQYHFLITFVHELAHLITHLNHQRSVSPHGKEWKNTFAHLLIRFTQKKIFPPDIETAIMKSIHNLSASTCSDPELYRVLRLYDLHTPGHLVESLALGTIFKTEKGKHFRLISKRRTRYECVEIDTGKKFLFPGIYEVFKE
jgi:SprT protein